LEELEDRRVLAPIVTFHGGPLLDNVQVQAVYYDWDVNIPAQANLMKSLDNFLTAIVPSAYLSSLSPQYRVMENGANYLAGMDDVIAPPAGGAPANINDTSIQQQLEKDIGNATLTDPAVTPNIFYFVFTAPGSNLIMDNAPGQPSTSKGSFAAYHSTSTTTGMNLGQGMLSPGEYSYAVMQVPKNWNFCNLTTATSHELVEGVTDVIGLALKPGGAAGNWINTWTPIAIPTGWYFTPNGAGGEIADLTEAFPPLNFNGYCVAQIWSNLIVQNNFPHILLQPNQFPPVNGGFLPVPVVNGEPPAVNVNAPKPGPKAPTGSLTSPPGGPGGPVWPTPPSTQQALPTQPHLSVNLLNGSNVALTSQNFLQVSTNGGTSWSQQFTFPLPANGDSSAVFDEKGQLYWADLVTSTNGIAVSVRNPTTGAAVGTPYTVDTPPAGYSDTAESLASNSPNQNPALNPLYLTWTRLGPNNSSASYLSLSTNQGQTWSTPTQVSTATDGYTWGSTVSLGPNGEVFVAYHSQPGYTVTSDGGIVPNGTSGQTVVVGYSTNLGALLTRTLAFGPGQSDVTTNVQTGNRTISGINFTTQGAWIPYVLADPARPGTVYVVAENDPNPGVTGNVDHADIVLATSTDYGRTWTNSTVESAATLPNPVISYSAQLMPTATIDANGDLLISWYSNQKGQTDAQGEWKLNTYAAFSTDGGQDWSAPVEVDNNQAFDPRAGAVTLLKGPPATTGIGNSFGVALSNDSAYAAWTGNTFTNGQPTGEQVIFDSFSLEGTLQIYGAQASSTIRIVRASKNGPLDEVFVNNTLVYSGSLVGIAGGIQIQRGQDVDSFEESGPIIDNVTVFLDYSNGDPVPTGGVQFNGSDLETNSIQVNANANYTLGDTSLTIQSGAVTDTVTLDNVSIANLTGGPGNSTFTLSNWSGTASLSGGAGTGTVLVAAGTVQSSSLTLAHIGTLQVTGGTFVVNTNLSLPTLQVETSGTLVINDQITLAAAVTNAGILDPEGSVTISGSYTQTSTGILNINIGGTTPGGSGYDQLNVTGAATLAGTLNVFLVNSFTPVSGNAFEILTFATSTGNFTAENFPGLGGGLLWDPVTGSNNLTLNAIP